MSGSPGESVPGTLDTGANVEPPEEHAAPGRPRRRRASEHRRPKAEERSEPGAEQWAPGSPRRSRLVGVLLTVLGLLLIAGGAYTAYLGFTGRGPADRTEEPSETAPTATPTTPPSGTTAPPSPEGLVQVAPALRTNPNVDGVVTTLERYFTAINERDYQAYVDSLTHVEGRLDTEEKFLDGYRSTHNSRVRLVGMVPRDGDVAATVAWRSEQDPVDSPDGQSDCLDWVVTFPMVPTDEGFRIDIVRRFATTYHPC